MLEWDCRSGKLEWDCRSGKLEVKMSRTISPATTTVKPMGTSFEEARFRSGEVGRLRLEMLAGKDADMEVGDDG
ncbi:hypothetical protein QVD17_36929 [Tagetes erecta]|uniref:Uncharacterized protein n=1 Tax=Tagetes erecta TaxID=13708 RepID=A0AAD8JTL8_TARER|nr:hypothetical protein QVD17_36929 [Tagetes erecta]